MLAERTDQLRAGPAEEAPSPPGATRPEAIAKLGHPLRFLGHHWRWIVVGVIALVATNALAQTIPWVVKRTVETIGRVAKGGADSRMILWLALLTAGLAVGQALSRIVSRIFIFNAGREAEYELRRALFSHFCVLDGGFYRRFRTGDLMSRLTNDLSSVRAFFGAGVLHVANTLFAYAVALPLMIAIDPWLTLWTLLPYPLLLLGIRVFTRRMYQRSLAQQRALAAMTAAVQEDLAGIRELKSYRLEEQRSRTFTERSRDYLHQAVRLTLWRTGLWPFMGAGAGASLVIVLWVGGAKVTRGELSLGDLVALNLYVGLLAWPTLAIGWILSLWQRGISAWHRLREILSVTPELLDRGGPPPPSMGVELRGLTAEIDGRPVLHDLSLTIPEGTLCAVVGRVGSGKTTLAQVIARLLEIPEKTLFYGGEDARQLSLAKVRERIAYAPQDGFLFSATLEDNIAFGLDGDDGDRDARIQAAIHAAGLEPDLDALPQGLQTVVGERGIVLSGGQRQRVALARALVSSRPFLILDDSLSAIDAETESRILEQLKQLLAGRTALLISHRLAALQHADQVIVLDSGRVAERGTHPDLLAAGGLYAQLYEQQLLAVEG